jgi:hypothetical protein
MFWYIDHSPRSSGGWGDARGASAVRKIPPIFVGMPENVVNNSFAFLIPFSGCAGSRICGLRCAHVEKIAASTILKFRTCQSRFWLEDSRTTSASWCR